jgi:HEPN domain-containing protein
LHDEAAFHCQQAIEKYLKGLLHEFGLPTPKTHDIKHLLDLLIPSDRHFRSLRRGSDTLTRFAVEFRYPGLWVSAKRAKWALRKAKTFRKEVRLRLGLSP